MARKTDSRRQPGDPRRFVSEPSEILANLRTLHAALAGRDPDAKAVASELLREGRNFVVVRTADGLRFAPSRFAGYARNTLNAHLKDTHKHGSRTDHHITRALGVERAESTQLQRSLRKYLRHWGVPPPKGYRKRFWRAGRYALPRGAPATDASTVDRDIQKILRQRGLASNEREQLILARIGQGEFRKALLDRFHRRCVITGCRVEAALRASHCRPWHRCDPQDQRNPANGLLLVANLDALFDRYLITVELDGTVRRSEQLTRELAQSLGLARDRALHGRFEGDQASFLADHNREFDRRERRRAATP